MTAHRGRSILVLVLAAGLSGMPARGAGDPLAAVRSDSLFICSQGLDRVVADHRLDAVPVIVERLADPRTDPALCRTMIDTLVALGEGPALSALVENAHNGFNSTNRSRLEAPTVAEDATLESVVAAVSEASARSVPVYGIERLCGLHLLSDVSPIASFLAPETPPLAAAAALLRLHQTSVPPEQLVDRILDLTRAGEPAVRVLAIRALFKILPAEDAGRLALPFLRDPVAAVREAVIAGAAATAPAALAAPLAAHLDQEPSTRLRELLVDAVDACRSTARFRTFVTSAGWLLVVAVLVLLASTPWLMRLHRRWKLARALRLMDTADYGLAAVVLRELMPHRDETSARARLHLVRCLLRSNDLDGAVPLIDGVDGHALELPDLYALAVDLDGKDLKTRAVGFYLQMMERNPVFADVKARFDAIDAKLGGGRTVDRGVDLTSTTSLIDMLGKSLSGEYGEFSLLGKGGMGAVFRARVRRTGDWVAIKVLSPALADRESIRTRFFREAVAIANLSHPNICGIRDVKKAELPFIVMEYLHGKSLKDIIKDLPAPMRRDEFLKLALPLMDALAFAHAKSIVHRDIKPENIMVTTEGIPKLLDFGLVKFKETASDITSTGDMMGTPMYMSPEQLKGETAVDGRADIFSLGLVFYEMVTLGYPFPKKAVFQRVFLKAESARLLNPTLPAQLDRVLLNCLETDPEDRPSTMDELRGLVETVAEFWNDQAPSTGVARVTP